jgi:hypothetical protein
MNSLQHNRNLKINNDLMKNNALSLADHQLEMTSHLRNPTQIDAPKQVDERRVGIYRDLVFNNIESQLSTSFPVIHDILSEDQWLNLVRDFIRDFRAQTPYFSQLSAEFVAFLNERQADTKAADELPHFLLELAHYERIELDLYMLDRDTEQQPVSEDQLLNTPLALANIAIPLAYQNPVHQISPDFQPEITSEHEPRQPTCLLLFQDKDEDVRFFELQPLAYQLVLSIANNNADSTPENHEKNFAKTGYQLLQELALTFQQQNNALFLQQGEGLLKQLWELNVLVQG